MQLNLYLEGQPIRVQEQSLSPCELETKRKFKLNKPIFYYYTQSGKNIYVYLYLYMQPNILKTTIIVAVKVEKNNIH